MYSKPINQTLKEVFQEIYDEANGRAEFEFEQILKEIADVDHFHQLEKLIEKHTRLEEQKNESEYSFYITNHSSETWLLNQFSNRHYLLNVNESSELAEAIYTGKLAQLVQEKKYELKDTIPKYSYKKFIAGEECPYLTAFAEYYNITSNDYYKIRNWQTKHLIDIVTYESLFLIRQMQQFCSTLANPLQFISEQRALIENYIDQPIKHGAEIKQVLLKLYVFKGLNCSNFDEVILQQAHNAHYNSEIYYAKLNPDFLFHPISQANKKFEGLISNEATIFETVSKIRAWLDLVLCGQSVQQPVLAANWNNIYKNLMTRAEETTDDLIHIIEDKAYFSNLSKNKIRKYLIEELDKYRDRFNRFEKKYMLHLFRDEKKYLLKQMFITNSFFSNNILEQEEAIIESMTIHKLCWNIVQIYVDIFDTHKLRYSDNNVDYIEIMHLVNQMVLNKEIHDEMTNSIDNFFQHTHAYFLPFEIHFHNQFDMLKNVYRKAIDRLTMILDQAEPNNKILYLQSRLKETKHRVLKLKELKEVREVKKKQATYLKRFEEFLLIEAEFIHQTRDLSLNTVLLPNPQKTISVLPDDQLLSPDNMDFIMQMLEHLSVTKDGKSTLQLKSKSALRGIAEALLESKILPPISLERSYRLIAGKIGMPINSKLDHSTTSDSYKKVSEKYIKENHPLQKVLSGRRDSAG